MEETIKKFNKFKKATLPILLIASIFSVLGIVVTIIEKDSSVINTCFLYGINAMNFGIDYFVLSRTNITEK